MTDELVPKLQTFIRAKDPQGTAVLEGHDYLLKFSTLGAPQELRIQYIPRNSWTILYSARSPGATERWFVESKWVWFPEHSGCARVKLASLDPRYKLFASDGPFLRSVVGSPEMTELLMQLPAENHFKANLKDGVLTLSWSVRFNPASNDRNGILLNCAIVMSQLGGQCFKSLQVARMVKGSE
ncbi:MAG TPA: hypothetical protein VE981_24635 [Planctomycetota bacterium]|nr:hypothetical protein [Planctomycetota bacterium]